MSIRAHASLHASKYVGIDGCMHTLFTVSPDGACPVGACPVHWHDYQPHCSDCSKAQHLHWQSSHELAENAAIQASLDNSEIIWTSLDGQSKPTCSKHHEDFQELCPTCQEVVRMYDSAAGYELEPSKVV